MKELEGVGLLGVRRRGQTSGHPFAKFSDEAIRTAIRMTRAGYPRTDIRAVTGLSFAHINTVCRGLERADLYDAGDAVPDLAALIESCENLGAVLRWARWKGSISQQEPADATGVTVRTVSRWEGGKRTPHPSSIRKVAAALGVSAEQVLTTRLPQACRNVGGPRP